ncbi:phage tail protein [Pandoraea nosoerga]|uniref:phage tail protein n=1 Tax=Pandoraea nosoerga TaxID=2508296 RepID=UPI00197CEDDB|nr:phage tail protein [Pandoraea nosoerga]MBN4664220.1 phage tail protein [Pandoraea nosoerga]MBN4675371.1 phage tail protein [Pandoraea nosoerga]MBN4679308.1 phage tail protein [Pandoraea nosoerga]MBN4743695.1 phage tail protein [Pandoraea nosoerga]
METKTVYQTDEHGFYLYPMVAYELSLSPGHYNVPYGAVEPAPPPAADGMVARWREDAWSVVEDHRREMLYVTGIGAQYQIGSIIKVEGENASYDGGGPIPSWLTTTAPTSAEPPSAP